MECCTNQINGYLYSNNNKNKNDNVVLDIVEEMFNLASISILKISFNKNIKENISKLMTEGYFICGVLARIYLKTSMVFFLLSGEQS